MLIKALVEKTAQSGKKFYHVFADGKEYRCFDEGIASMEGKELAEGSFWVKEKDGVHYLNLKGSERTGGGGRRAPYDPEFKKIELDHKDRGVAYSYAVTVVLKCLEEGVLQEKNADAIWKSIDYFGKKFYKAISPTSENGSKS